MPQAKLVEGAMFATLSVNEHRTIAKAAELFDLLDSMNVAGAEVALASLLPFVLPFGGQLLLPIVKPKQDAKQ